MDYKVLCEKVKKLCLETGVFIAGQAFDQKDIEVKSKNSLVTYVDKTAEKLLIEGLRKMVPQGEIIAEESASNFLDNPLDCVWIIDPLDGTTNYIHGLPVYCISIALVVNKEIVLGVVYEINQKECFYTWKNAPSYLNGVPIKVSERKNVSESLIATGFPYQDYEFETQYLALLKCLMRESRGIRRLGSAAADLAYVACGRFDSFYEYGLSPWDVAAGILLVQNAGGVVSDFKGNNNSLFGEQIVASNTAIHTQMLKYLGQYF